MSDACCAHKGISYPRILWIALVANEPRHAHDLARDEVDRGDRLAPAAAHVDQLVDLALPQAGLGAVVAQAPRLLREALEHLVHRRPVAVLQPADGDEPSTTPGRLAGTGHEPERRRCARPRQ